jgi:hypothetical protein
MLTGQAGMPNTVPPDFALEEFLRDLREEQWTCGCRIARFRDIADGGENGV